MGIFHGKRTPVLSADHCHIQGYQTELCKTSRDRHSLAATDTEHVPVHLHTAQRGRVMLQDCGQAAVTQTATRRPSVAMQLAGSTPCRVGPRNLRCLKTFSAFPQLFRECVARAGSMLPAADSSAQNQIHVMKGARWRKLDMTAAIRNATR